MLRGVVVCEPLVLEVCGRACRPRDCAAGVCVRKAKGGVCVAGSWVSDAADDLRFGAREGCKRAFSRARVASLRVRSARRAA